MRRVLLIGSATVLDWILGDPESWPHPVRLMGAACAAGERWLRRSFASPSYELLAGAGLTVAIVGGSYGLTCALLRPLYRLDPRVGAAAELALASTCLASHSLLDEASSVMLALSGGNFPGARLRLARIVGRDAQTLNEHGISRAVIETLAESCCDGIVAPLFYLTLFGVPGAMAFKAISTLDSMIGHRTPEYLYFGRVAARLDDLANLLPARITALLIVSLARNRQLALTTWRRDGRLHASPNAGHPEAAMAGALGVQLGGPSTYDGQPHQSPELAAGCPLPTARDARRAMRLVRRVSILACMLAMGGAWFFERRTR